MAVKRLTIRSVKAVSPGVRDIFVWDDELTGFGLKVTPAGRRIYIVQYRVPRLGRRATPKRVTVGEHGALTPDEARSHAKALLASVATGGDPAQHRADVKKAPTVADVAALFLADVKAKKKHRTAYEYARQMKSEILPALGKVKAKDVTRGQIAALHDAGRSRPYAANRGLALASAFFSWCERRGYRDPATNPCRGVERYPEKKRERYLTHEEMGRLGEALRTAEKDGANSISVAVIRFLTLSGWREQEALTLRWDALDFQREFVTLEDTKSGRTVKSIGNPAWVLLAELPRFENNPFVFPGRAEGAHLVELRRVWDRVRDDADLAGVRLHDLRHSFASVAASGGASLPLIGALLGHHLPATTARYAHLTDNSRKVVADRTAGDIAASMDGRAETASRTLRGIR